MVTHLVRTEVQFLQRPLKGEDIGRDLVEGGVSVVQLEDLGGLIRLGETGATLPHFQSLLSPQSKSTLVPTCSQNIYLSYLQMIVKMSM